MDGTSQRNMIRALPKTCTVVKNLGGLDFKGHHKVGDNSNLNVWAIMTGNTNYKDATIGEEFVRSKHRRRWWTAMYLREGAWIIN